MTKVIQQISYNDGKSYLYLTGWDEDNKILRYRSDTSGREEVSEEVVLTDDGKVVLSGAWFDVHYLLKFIEENKEDEG